MKPLFPVVAGLFALAAVPASAADLPLPAKAPIAPAYNWTGFYLGGNVGYTGALDQFSGFTTVGGITTATFSDSVHTSGVSGGGQAGFNYELPYSVVLGVEADGDWTNSRGGNGFCTSATNCSFHRFDIDDYGTVRGRLGYAWNNVLFYGTGGWAWTDRTNTATLIKSSFPALVGASVTDSRNLSGWVWGAGFEVGLISWMPNVTLRFEYLHLQFDNINEVLNFGTVPGVGPLVSNSKATLGIDTARVGVNYLFNWGAAPMMARY
jgi:outer membrane immunogenic protein